MELILFLLDTGVEAANRQAKMFMRAHNRRRAGKNAWKSLKPGNETPLWNGLRSQLRPHLRRYGSQANLGRILGLPRQQINAFVTGGGRMPDAERTLELLVWLSFVRSRPAETSGTAKTSSIS